MWQKISLPYSDLDKADTTLTSGDQWGEFTAGAARSTLSLDMAGNAAVTLDAERDYLDPVSGKSQADAYGVYLWLIPAIADSGGSADSGSTSPSSDSGMDDAGLGNFLGPAWTGTEHVTLSCADAGTHAATGSDSVVFQPTAAGFTLTDKNGCVFDFAASGATATLTNAPVSCMATTDAGTQFFQFTSVTLTSNDGHQMTLDGKGTISEQSLSCSFVETGMFTR
jgi:hypothetical protein